MTLVSCDQLQRNLLILLSNSNFLGLSSYSQSKRKGKRIVGKLGSKKAEENMDIIDTFVVWSCVMPSDVREKEIPAAGNAMQSCRERRVCGAVLDHVAWNFFVIVKRGYENMESR